MSNNLNIGDRVVTKGGRKGVIIPFPNVPEGCFLVSWYHGGTSVIESKQLEKIQVQTKTLTGQSGTLDRWIADHMSDGWTVAYEGCQLDHEQDGSKSLIHIIRLQREIPPSQFLDDLRAQAKRLVEED